MLSKHWTVRHQASSGEVYPPEVIDDVDGYPWDEATDVLVAGFGAAGACAALQAREAGSDVLVVDRFEGGGASQLSGGVVYAGGGTAQQREAGISDTPEAMFEYLSQEVGDAVSPATLARFCEESAANLEWLETHGARFASTTPARKTSYPPDGVFLYYSGNETVPARAGRHPSAMRGHRTVSAGQSGATLYAALKKSVRAHGAAVWKQAAVRRLYTDRAGRVVGAEVWRLPEGSAAAQRHTAAHREANLKYPFNPNLAESLRHETLQIELAHARPVRVRARSGVVLASGGFMFNRQMLEAHAPKYLANWRNGSTGCDGSGIRLGQAAGGATARMEKVSAWRFISPPYAWPMGVAVNRRGQRFCNEEVYGSTLGNAIIEEQGGRAWLLLDSRLRAQAIRECFGKELWGFQKWPALAGMLLGCTRAFTLNGLARKLGMDAALLTATIEANNRAARGECEDEVGKSAAMRRELTRGPWYALDLSPHFKFFPLSSITLGGLTVSETTGEVLRGNGTPIKGLYAAGRAAAGIPSNIYLSGLSLADCVFSGRRAARHAVASAQPATSKELTA
ncbi:FAD-binding protein [Crenobacter caeni]|uniref:FAD-binding protein n=1 Tax=Crenobacter caeni TaxID=2705474 RepID=A0A6B2KR63_9NEIS|nr:FAD-binding protein [Crenobacter caeni]NDV12722.1 FAD-binding protein [Crenobacter caeni]